MQDPKGCVTTVLELVFLRAEAWQDEAHPLSERPETIEAQSTVGSGFAAIYGSLDLERNFRTVNIDFKMPAPQPFIPKSHSC